MKNIGTTLLFILYANLYFGQTSEESIIKAKNETYELQAFLQTYGLELDSIQFEALVKIHLVTLDKIQSIPNLNDLPVEQQKQKIYYLNEEKVKSILLILNESQRKKYELIANL